MLNVGTCYPNSMKNEMIDVGTCHPMSHRNEMIDIGTRYPKLTHAQRLWYVMGLTARTGTHVDTTVKRDWYVIFDTIYGHDTSKELWYVMGLTARRHPCRYDHDTYAKTLVRNGVSSSKAPM